MTRLRAAAEFGRWRQPAPHPNMKSISAAIIVVAGSALILGGSYIPHSDTKLFVQIVGCGVGTVGLWGWFVSLKEK